MIHLVLIKNCILNTLDVNHSKKFTCTPTGIAIFEPLNTNRHHFPVFFSDSTSLEVPNTFNHSEQCTSGKNLVFHTAVGLDYVTNFTRLYSKLFE